MPHRRAQIVIIDDQPSSVELHIKALQDDGHSVQFFPTADAALVAFGLVGHGKLTVDFIVIDIMMPEPKTVAAGSLLQGLETGAWLTRKYREVEATSPIVVLTQLNPAPVVKSLWKNFEQHLKDQGAKVPVVASGDEMVAVLQSQWNVTVWEKGMYKPSVFAAAVNGLLGIAGA